MLKLVLNVTGGKNDNVPNNNNNWRTVNNYEQPHEASLKTSPCFLDRRFQNGTLGVSESADQSSNSHYFGSDLNASYNISSNNRLQPNHLAYSPLPMAPSSLYPPLQSPLIPPPNYTSRSPGWNCFSNKYNSTNYPIIPGFGMLPTQTSNNDFRRSGSSRLSPESFRAGSKTPRNGERKDFHRTPFAQRRVKDPNSSYNSNNNTSWAPPSMGYDLVPFDFHDSGYPETELESSFAQVDRMSNVSAGSLSTTSSTRSNSRRSSQDSFHDYGPRFPYKGWRGGNRGRGRSRDSRGAYQNYQSSTTARSWNHEPAIDSAVQLHVSNLDQSIEAREMRKILMTLFSEYTKVLDISVLLNQDGNLISTVKVPTLQDAQYAISQLQRRQIGFKRMQISLHNTSTPSPSILKAWILALFQDIPNKRIPLFKFRELFEKRYHQSVSVSELYRLKEVVVVHEDTAGRTICLNPGIRHRNTTNSAFEEKVLDSMEPWYCIRHTPEIQNPKKGWAEQEGPAPLPNVVIGLKTLAEQVNSLLSTHDGILHLESLLYCYNVEIGELPINENGVPLEHLITCLPSIVIRVNSSGVKIVVKSEEKMQNQQIEARCISPSLAGQLSLFCREVVDLLKTMPKCLMKLSKFIPAYHHHFGRQCRVADYGFTKLLDLFECIPNVVQIIGDSNKPMLTLTHRAQIRRFTADLLRLLKSQASKQICLSNLPQIYNKCLSRDFEITSYGVCEMGDMLSHVPDNTVVVIGTGNDTVIAIPKRGQTPEEIEATKMFTLEVIEILRHSPHSCMSFNKFIPSYHHHFGRQCRVSDYGFTKLIELFEAIPEVLEVYEGEDDKMLKLAEPERLKVLSDQITSLVKSCYTRQIAVEDLMDMFTQYFGFSIHFDDYSVENVEELLEKMKHAVKVETTSRGIVVTLVDRAHVYQLSLRIRRILMEQESGSIELPELDRIYSDRFKQHLDVNTIAAQLQEYVQISENESSESVISLVPVQMFARDLHVLLHEKGGRIAFSQLETRYLERFGTTCQPAQYGYASLGSLLQVLKDVCVMRGRGPRRVVCLNRDTAKTPLYSWVHSTRLRFNTPVQTNNVWQTSDDKTTIDGKYQEGTILKSPAILNKDLIKFESPPLAPAEISPDDGIAVGSLEGKDESSSTEGSNSSSERIPSIEISSPDTTQTRLSKARRRIADQF